MTPEPGLLFDRVAEEYDRVRSDYPASLVDTACSMAGLRAGSPVVEIGCGTGKLTAALAERGLHVEAVDPGPRMVALARRRVGSSTVNFRIGRFEDVDLPAAGFEAAFSATAFHWIDPSVGWAKAAGLLQPGGMLALLSHAGFSALDDRFHAIWKEVQAETITWEQRDRRTLVEGVEARLGNVSEVWAWLSQRNLAREEAAEMFTDVRLATVTTEEEETADRLLAVVRTTSTYLGLDASRRRRLEQGVTAVIDEVGGSFRSTTLALLVTHASRPRPASRAPAG